MGLSIEQEKAREEDANVRYLAQNICNKDGNKDYVFISYKSDDWEIVLKEIVYKLVKEYGLNVYFDGDFKDNNPHWTTQFPENMESGKCKGVLVFLNDKYATSYATLMELMHSQFGCQDDHYNFISKPVVPINLVKALSVIDDESDTGLGKRDYFNGEKKIKNIKAQDERALFDDDFNRGCEFNVIKKTKKPYLKDKELSKKLCAVVVEEVLASIDYNDNFYNGSLDGIVSSIKSVCGETVFHEKKGDTIYNVVIINDEEKTTLQVKADGLIPKQNCGVKDGFIFKGWFVEGTEKEWDFESNVVTQDITLVAKYEKIISNEGTISLKTFLKGYSNDNFKKNTYKKFRLIGQGNASRFSTDFQESAFDLVWDFVMGLLSERGKAYIDEVNSKHPEVKNPAFIDLESYEKRDDKNKYRQITIDGLNNYYMYRHYSQYDWIGTVLKQRISEFGLKIDDFFFEYIPGDGPIISDISIGDPEPPKLVDIFEYELWGITHTSKKMVDMLNAVFDLIAEKYPERISNIAESDKITAVARKADLDQGTANVSKIKQFSHYKGKEHPLNGDVYCVNAGYNLEGCIKQIEKMLILCDENPNVFKITKKPEKSTRSVSKSGKEGLGEILNQ